MNSTTLVIKIIFASTFFEFYREMELFKKILTKKVFDIVQFCTRENHEIKESDH
jgi:hypothetical protein